VIDEMPSEMMEIFFSSGMPVSLSSAACCVELIVDPIAAKTLKGTSVM
jgi:hypothetical protein